MRPLRTVMWLHVAQALCGVALAVVGAAGGDGLGTALVVCGALLALVGLTAALLARRQLRVVRERDARP
jgi:VIT1/CCC1 family predicted Fe2+/Mn2+ transporter